MFRLTPLPSPKRHVGAACLVALAAWGCKKGDEGNAPTDATTETSATADTGSQTDPCADSIATWENVAEPFLDNWCTPCHSSQLSEGERQGAPAGLDFDGWENAAPLASLILSSATGDAPRMPPTGGTHADERLRMAEWVACGAPGPSTPPGPCDTLVEGDSEDPCAEGLNTVTGDLVADGRDLSCLCAVGGDLALAGPAVDLPLLASVGGSVSAGVGLTSLSAPLLATVGGDLSLVGASGLSAWSTPELLSVGGHARFEGPMALPRLRLERLTTVGADLLVTGVAGMTDLELQRVEEVGGSYRVTGNPDLTTADFFYELDRVGGDLVVADNPGLGSLLLATYLVELGGSVEVGGNGLQLLSLFHDLTAVGGDVYLHDEPLLTSIQGLEDVTSIGGALRFERMPLLTGGPDMDVLSTVGSYHLVDLDVFDGDQQAGALVEVLGDVEVVNCRRLVALPWMDGVQRIGGGALLQDVGLTGFGTWKGLTEIGGDLTLRGLRDLDALDQLDELEGVRDLTVEACPAVQAIDLPSLERAVDVRAMDLGSALVVRLGSARLSGDLQLTALGGITSLAPLHDLREIRGTLVVTNNPTLPAAEVDALSAAVPPAAVVAYGNGP